MSGSSTDLRIRSSLVVLLLCLFHGASAPASEIRQVEVDVHLTPSRVAFVPAVDYEWAILRLRGADGWSATEVLEGDEAIAYQLGEDDRPGDGPIQWRLSLKPSGAVDPADRRIQSGGFRIVSGGFLSGRERPPARRVPSAAAAIPDATVREGSSGTTPTHFGADVTIETNSGLCAGCAPGDVPSLVDPDAPVVLADVRLGSFSTLAFGDATPLQSGSLQLIDLEFDGVGPKAIVKVFDGPTIATFAGTRNGFGLSTPDKELHLLGEPIPDGVLGTRSSPEIRLEAEFDPFIGSPSTRDWDVGASTQAFFVRDATADVEIFRIVAGATGGLTLADNRVEVDGDLVLPRGGVTAGTVRLASSRATKERLERVDETEVLRRLSEIPVYEWSFREDAGARHVGPMAEDFHAAFPLEGQSAEHLSVTDVAGVTLAAIQALERRVAALEAENRALRREIEAQQVSDGVGQ